MREYVEKRGSGLFVTGTRIAIESIVCEYKEGASPESILLAYPEPARSKMSTARLRGTWLIKAKRKAT
jgi:uncharacterized protein (DUF433 family)